VRAHAWVELTSFFLPEIKSKKEEQQADGLVSDPLERALEKRAMAEEGFGVTRRNGRR